MFVVSVKTGKKRMILVLAALLAVLTALLAAAKLLGTAHGADSLPAGETNGNASLSSPGTAGKRRRSRSNCARS